MVTSLRFWLIASFSAILFICSIAVFLFIKSYQKSKDLEEYHAYLNTTRILLLETNKLKEDILLGEYTDNGFYTSNYSAAELRYTELKKEVNAHISYLKNSKLTAQHKLNWKVNQIKDQFSNYNQTYNELTFLFKLKGFKNYGLEGRMRDYAHKIFDYPNKNVQYYCLILRKHEKDFLLRKDFYYVNQFQMEIKSLIDIIQESSKISSPDKNYLINCVYYYEKFFNQLVRIESKIGVNGQKGFLNKSKISFDNIAMKIQEMDEELRQIEFANKESLKKDTYTVLSVLIIFLISTIVVFTRVITTSVKSISRSFEKYVNSGFNIDSIIYKRTNIKEFKIINVSFLKMVKEIHVFTNFFREKVHERTIALNQQKDEILAQQVQIENQYKILLANNNQLDLQKQMLSVKNKDIQDSLRYAKRIQTALQPSKLKLKECFEDYFLFTKSKDVVSGDFHLVYRTTKTEGFEDNKIVFLAADCTGHGVPGAIMSVLGINTLYKNIKELKNSDPGKILNLLDEDLNQVLAFEKNNSEIVADGMDIAVFSFNKSNYQLDYSIAKFNHFLVRDSNIISLKTQKSSIGYSYFETNGKNFETTTIQLQPGDCLYLFSDGFQDQFGGPFNKKYKRTNLRNLMISLQKMAMKEQKKVFKTEFKTWKKSYPQTDDVLVLGIRF